MLFNEDQLAIQDLARRFAREKLAPQYQARDKSGVLDKSLIREMGELGLMGADLPEADKQLILGGNLRRMMTPILESKGIRLPS